MMTNPKPREWRVSKKRLQAVEDRLIAIEREQSALDIGGPRAEAPRFACAADEHRWDELAAEWKRLYTLREDLQLAIWFRERRSQRAS
jgi:hypothetical protein